MPAVELGPEERRFVERSIRQRRAFGVMSALGVVVGVGLGLYYAFGGVSDPPVLKAVLVILVLLNARSNLRQYRYARILEKLTTGRTRP